MSPSPHHHRDALSLVERVPRLWRRVRDRCLECGKSKPEHRDCLHCESDRTRCHHCNKWRNFMLVYGGERR